MGLPVDIEFACDGKDFYILQCRPQSHSDDSGGARIPTDVPPERVLFTANKYVTNGRVPDITHIVYVDPKKYGELPERSDMLAVGRAVSRLNQLLPKQQFILMGPGRWGSRGDIKLGVSVSYSDINNASVLIEIARKNNNYTPDLSFGTHFFQDLVEAQIRYLPLYPDDPDAIFNERFFKESPNLLPILVPEFAHMADIVKLIDVPQAADGRVLQVLMDADHDQAMGLLALPGGSGSFGSGEARRSKPERTTESYWRWRYRMAEQIASERAPARFGVKAFYLLGSTKNATAGPGSDINILVHFIGSAEQRDALSNWLDGWSRCLSEINFAQTGYQSAGLLDVHIITDEDIVKGDSYAQKINAVTDAVKELPLGTPRK
jgi:pyruvate, water dikinase